MRTRALWLAASLALGCVRPVGLERYDLYLDARTEDCELRYVTLHARDPNAMTGYVKVAAITVRHPPAAWTPELEAKVQPLACRAGGDTIGLLLLDQEPSRTLLVLRDTLGDGLAGP